MSVKSAKRTLRKRMPETMAYIESSAWEVLYDITLPLMKSGGTMTGDIVLKVDDVKVENTRRFGATVVLQGDSKGSGHIVLVREDGRKAQVQKTPQGHQADLNTRTRLRRRDRADGIKPKTKKSKTGVKVTKPVKTKETTMAKANEVTMTTHEVSDLLAIPNTAVLRLVKQGLLTPVEPPSPGRITKFPIGNVEQVEQHLKQQATKAPAKPKTAQRAKAAPKPKAAAPKVDAKWERLMGMLHVADASLGSQMTSLAEEIRQS